VSGNLVAESVSHVASQKQNNGLEKGSLRKFWNSLQGMDNFQQSNNAKS